MRGNPDRCVAKSNKVIAAPLRCGVFTVAGKYLEIGSFKLNCFLMTISAKIMAVKTLLIEPISYSVFPSGCLALPSAVCPAQITSLPLVLMKPAAMPTLRFIFYFCI
jgi:hypothetical protein